MGTVQGTVTLNDSPYADAQIVFLSLETGQGSAVNIRPDGTFQLPDPLPVGTYTVYLAPQAEDDGDDHVPQPVTIDTRVPDKYWSEASSDISVEVTEGENRIPIELES